jgi:hypothetical protein
MTSYRYDTHTIHFDDLLPVILSALTSDNHGFLAESFAHIIPENRFHITMAEEEVLANRLGVHSSFILKLTKSIWNGSKKTALQTLKYICFMFYTVYERRQRYFAMRLVLVGDLIPCICMHWNCKSSLSYSYWAIRVLNKVIMQYWPTKERLINNGAFAHPTMFWGQLAASENEEVAMELMELFNMLLIVDTRTILTRDEVCKCIDAVFFMLRQWPNSLRLHMRAYNNLIWTCHRYGYYENSSQGNLSACLVMRKLNCYLRAEADTLLERTERLLSPKDRESIELQLWCALAKPRFSIDFSDLRIAHLDIIASERKDCLAILTLAIWKCKIEGIYGEEKNAKRRRTRWHLKDTRENAWLFCLSDMILCNVLPFNTPQVDYRLLPG